MAIAFDAGTGGVVVSGGSTSFSHTCSGSDRYLFVSTNHEVTAVTYNSVAMTLVASDTPTFPPGTNCTPIKVWGLSNPATGSNTIACTIPSNNSNVVAVSYTGCSPAPFENSATSNSNNVQEVDWIGTVTTITPNAWRILFVQGANNSSVAFIAGTSTTHRVSSASGLAGSAGALDSGSAIATPGSGDLEVLWASGSGYLTVIAVSLAPKFESKGSFLEYFM